MIAPTPKRRGRPPRADAAATERIELRATPAERAEWIRRAGTLSLAAWIRERLRAP